MVNQNISIANARIGFRNFSGKESRYNQEGSRNFCVFLDTDIAKKLQEDGWNVRWLQPRNEDEAPQAYMQVAVSFKHIKPTVVQITHRGKTMLDEDTIGALDWAEIANVDLIIRPYNWAVNNSHGVKAYLKSMYVTLNEDEFAEKYGSVPELAGAADPF